MAIGLQYIVKQDFVMIWDARGCFLVFFHDLVLKLAIIRTQLKIFQFPPMPPYFELFSL